MGNKLQKAVPVRMVRNDLKDVPCFEFSAEYTTKWYEAEDEDIWFDIQSRADKYNAITPSLFNNVFGNSLELLQERQCFIFDSSDQAIGTGTAWFNDDYNGIRYGRLHWVAIVPEKQGLGLAKPLMTILCNRLRELRHDKVYLSTLSVRTKAINLYRKFGFRPELRNSKDLQIWKILETKLKTPLYSCAFQ